MRDIPILPAMPTVHTVALRACFYAQDTFWLYTPFVDSPLLRPKRGKLGCRSPQKGLGRSGVTEGARSRCTLTEILRVRRWRSVGGGGEGRWAVGGGRMSGWYLIVLWDVGICSYLPHCDKELELGIEEFIFICLSSVCLFGIY